MKPSRRAAQFGLAAALAVLLACFAVLFVGSSTHASIPTPTQQSAH